MLWILIWAIFPYFSSAKTCYRCTDGVLAFDKRFLSPNRDTSACTLMEITVPDSYKCIMESNYHKSNLKFSIISGGAPRINNEPDECRIKFDFKNSYMKCGCSDDKCNDSPPETMAVKIAVNRFTNPSHIYSISSRHDAATTTTASTTASTTTSFSGLTTTSGGKTTSRGSSGSGDNKDKDKDKDKNKSNNGKHKGHGGSGNGLDTTCYHVYHEIFDNVTDLFDCYDYTANLVKQYDNWNTSTNITKQPELNCTWCTDYDTADSQNCSTSASNRSSVGMFGGFTKAWCVRSNMTSEENEPVMSHFILDESTVQAFVGNQTKLTSSCYDLQQRTGNFTWCICEQHYCNLQNSFNN